MRARRRAIGRPMSLVESSILLDQSQFADLYCNAETCFERIALLPKSLIAMRGRA